MKEDQYMEIGKLIQGTIESIKARQNAFTPFEAHLLILTGIVTGCIYDMVEVDKKLDKAESGWT